MREILFKGKRADNGDGYMVFVGMLKNIIILF